ncbi:uncharacterized protein K452DRAFT_77785 [Aplosporella prunicola CBS 121167]|uniref:Fucose-specific lectin n=1 Tax=Aplosporella prunicola CBS 121167 TaxID=1176127 RepID=A0A6A6B5S3_9PEZI|nr:uncharacterized protein K452DRAFT_77785 [Aplosporella prunicola CBS 121167]KAF2139469.1 hypothetical protein K452DRAFT_77785 [Aplosporella prunicola CBS 121167]
MNEAEDKSEQGTMSFGQQRQASSTQPTVAVIADDESWSEDKISFNETNSESTPLRTLTADCPNPPEFYNASEIYPEVVRDGTALPEVIARKHSYSSKENLQTLSADNPTRQKRNRLRFWILVGLLAVVIIATVIGGVVGCTLREKPSTKTKILNTTALASVSYKRADGVSQYRVYFQAESGALWQTVWDSATEKWAASPLKERGVADVAGEPEVKRGTPLAAHVYGSVESEEYEYHLFFLDVSNKIWELVSTNPERMWDFSPKGALKGNYTAAASSNLASYGRQCGQECGNATSVVVWQSSDSEIWLAGYEPGYGWVSFSMNATVEPPPVQGTAIAVVSLGASEGVMSVYVNNGSPTRLRFNITDGWTVDGSLGGSIAPDAALAGLITNYDDANTETADVKVLATRPESSGGILLWQDGKLDTSWLNGNADPPLFSVSNFSAITSNQAGRVYALEETQITEWRWKSSNGSFVRVGYVITN